MLDWLRYLFRRTQPPAFAPDSFIVWEPCTRSHAEVVPGYVKYLLDLGFKVHVFMTPKRYDEGLFSRFVDPRIILHRLSQRSVRYLFRKHGIGQAHGILITTARKISGRPDYAREQSLFASRASKQKLLLVEHDVKPAFDAGALTRNIITLRKPYYENAETTVVNPHYFGTVSITPKNTGTTRFITIGAMRSKRRNTQVLVDAVNQLHKSGQTGFTITVIGRGSLKGIPSHLHRYFDIKGRVDFTTLYTEMERADFFLTLLDPNNAAHERYITTGTSGSFQLIYGFAKPCLIPEKFAAANRFSQDNSLQYSTSADLSAIMRKSMEMNETSYSDLQQHILHDAKALFETSFANLKTLIEP